MPNKVHPIKPRDVAAQKEKTFPDAVLSSFNELIALKWNGSCAIFRQDDVVALMVAKGLKREEIFDNGWLDVEDVYKSVGWSIAYDKPGYNEFYPATFMFKRKRKRKS